MLVQQGGDALRKEQTSMGHHDRDHAGNLPRFGPLSGVKPYSCFGGLMVEKVVVVHSTLARQGLPHAAAITRVWGCELSNLLTLSMVALGLLL